MSKLATIQKILNIEPIEGAGAIEVVTVLGWKIVVKKGEYNIGNLCCYIQIDTKVSEVNEFEFLRERSFRVRTIKLRKQISQGLIISLKDCKSISKQLNPKEDLSIFFMREGEDISKYIGVTKYEKQDNNPEKYEKPRIPKVWYKKWIYLFKYSVLYKLFPKLQKKLKSPFPTNLVSITDEERIQNMPKILEQYKGKEFVVSYKLDGSSITIIHNKVLGKSKYRICSRRFELHDKKNDWYKVFIETKFSEEIQKLVNHYKTDNIIVQGEAIGKFNGNHHNLEKEQIRLFNIYVNGKRLNQYMFIELCNFYNIPHCPEYCKIILNHSMEEILKLSEIPDVLNPNTNAEGLVWRCVEDNQSFKVINNNYLLKNEK